MNKLPPLYRAAMQISLENAGVEHPKVAADGKMTELLPNTSDRIPLTDPLFLVQAAVEADALLEVLSGHSFTTGQEVLEALGVADFDVLYQERRKIVHAFTTSDLKDCLFIANGMIGGCARNLKRSPKRS